MTLLNPILEALNFNDKNHLLSHISCFNSETDSSDIFAVTDLASSSIASAGLALADYVFGQTGRMPQVKVDQRLAYMWFVFSMRPMGWKLSSIWDDLAGDYRTSDGWIRLHTNAPHHRDVVCGVLGNLSRDALARQVEKWSAEELERAIVYAGGAAAQMMDAEQWARHEQGKAVSREPIISWKKHADGYLGNLQSSAFDSNRPLVGLKVLDLTRIIAGPVATRFLASFGANVLRIDPPHRQEGDYIIDLTPGKKCATLDFAKPDDLITLRKLISEADILVHGFRADALDRLGLGDEERRKINPSLIDVALNAYGWTGPWKNRRGFDSLLQMSSGIAAAGMAAVNSDKPIPLSVQALDHATGYLMAASVLKAAYHLRDNGELLSARLSLAATAELLKRTRRTEFGEAFSSEKSDDFGANIETTELGSVLRLKQSLEVSGMNAYWDSPGSLLHRSSPAF